MIRHTQCLLFLQQCRRSRHCRRSEKRVDSVEKSQRHEGENQLNLPPPLHVTLASLTIRFRATDVASALGHATLRVFAWKRPYEAEKIWSTADRLFQQNRPGADIGGEWKSANHPRYGCEGST